MSDLKKEIRFKNLPLLLKDMEIKKWVIDSFFFPYWSKNESEIAPEGVFFCFVHVASPKCNHFKC
mgnify:FL=1